MMPTAAQLRAARALLTWTMEALAERAGVSARTIRRAEEADQAVSVRSLRRLAAAYKAAGIEFSVNSGGEGVRLRR